MTTMLEQGRKVLRGELTPLPIARLLGFVMKSLEPSRAVFEMEVDERCHNPLGTLHGGCGTGHRTIGNHSVEFNPGSCFLQRGELPVELGNVAVGNRTLGCEKNEHERGPFGIDFGQSPRSVPPGLLNQFLREMAGKGYGSDGGGSSGDQRASSVDGTFPATSS